MKPIMWAALLASLAATAYVATQEGDEVEVVNKGGQADARRSSRTPAPRATPNLAPTPAATGKAAEAALRTRQSDQLMAAVAQLQTEALRAAQAPTGLPRPSTAAAVHSPWGSQLPPPPPPPPPAPPPPPMEPVAPPFPHAWVGRYVDDAPRAVIAGANTTWVLKVGDVVDGVWRIDTIQERQLGVTYLPLKQARSVTMK